MQVFSYLYGFICKLGFPVPVCDYLWQFVKNMTEWFRNYNGTDLGFQSERRI